MSSVINNKPCDNCMCYAAGAAESILIIDNECSCSCFAHAACHANDEWAMTDFAIFTKLGKWFPRHF